jgi:1-acyl-sn-glycerol-3-phosphate acyltransferase
MRLGLYRVVHAVVRTLARLLYRLEVVGRPVPPGGAVLAANHESVLDPFFIGLVTRRPVRFMAKIELWRLRPVGKAIEAMGGLPVDRGRGDREALAKLAALLREGWLVGIFPEGVVRETDTWHRGAAKLALLSGAPLVPVLIDGSGKALARGRVGLPRIRLVVGEPIPVEAAKPTIAAAKELTERLRLAVDALRTGGGRRATIEDAADVAEVFLAARAGMTYLPRVHTDEDTRGFVRDVVLREQEVWVAEAGGRIVGFAALSADVLEHLYVHPGSQGRGVGTLLFARAKERLPAGFRLWVFQQNDGARRFYERHGCRLVRETDGRDNEEGLPDALYEWRPGSETVER